jgi:hypothetical protein
MSSTPNKKKRKGTHRTKPPLVWDRQPRAALRVASEEGAVIADPIDRHSRPLNREEDDNRANGNSGREGRSSDAVFFLTEVAVTQRSNLLVVFAPPGNVPSLDYYIEHVRDGNSWPHVRHIVRGPD